MVAIVPGGATPPSEPTVYELPPAPGEEASRPSERGQEDAGALPASVLHANAEWFVRLRWIAIGVLLLLFVLGHLAHNAFSRLGFRAPIDWPLPIAGVLLAANVLFVLHARQSTRGPTPLAAKRSLWSQIVLDLLMLTLVVHFLGSLETHAPFMYLVHIVLACIFFSRRQSLKVAAVACVLYVTCVVLETLGLVPAAAIYADVSLRRQMALAPGVLVAEVGSAIGVCLVVWYLASRLSSMLRAREAALAESNRRMEAAQVEKTRHMLRTTHELKAPFAAIAANTQLLLRGSYGALPSEATEVLERIAARCRRLAHEIHEMLQLANLQSTDVAPVRADLDLGEIVRWSVAHLGAGAQGRRVTIEPQIATARIVAVEDHIKMLLTNVITNAIAYSNEGGTVRVTCASGQLRGPVVTVEDDGIGIAPEKLPKIFDDYYRTDEAARHNKDSTGLGLAIVRRVAQAHGIRVTVQSAPNRGTRVTLQFPRPR